jgi:hypothetical protein
MTSLGQGLNATAPRRKSLSSGPANQKERDMTNEKKRDTAKLSVAVTAAGLVLGFVVFSLAVGYVATHTGLLPDGHNSDTWIASSATIN